MEMCGKKMARLGGFGDGDREGIASRKDTTLLS
jgi:hypothetical protein